MKRNCTGSSGFTLIELLIAMLIVGVMASAVIPLLGTYTKQSKAAAAEANTLLLNKAADRYNLVHKAPLGWVYDATQNPPLVEYGLADASGVLAQLYNPTDVNGNVMGDPILPAPGPYTYGPYVDVNAYTPASILLYAAQPRLPRGMPTSLFKFGGSGANKWCAVGISNKRSRGASASSDVVWFSRPYDPTATQFRANGSEHPQWVCKQLNACLQSVHNLQATGNFEGMAIGCAFDPDGFGTALTNYHVEMDSSGLQPLHTQNSGPGSNPARDAECQTAPGTGFVSYTCN